MTERVPMGVGKSRVIYVAASARELPEALQEWLAQPNLRAAASPNVYDALAILSRGQTPLALIVSVDSIDWNELDFFTLARRVSPDTLLYITGDGHQVSKIEAAVALGARRFEADALNELLSGSTAPQAVGPAGLLAGSLRTDVEAAPPRLARETPETPDVAPAVEETLERPAVRLVSSSETEETESAVPFPWSPAPDRPQRTPPKPASAAGRETKKTSREPVKEASRRPPVKLTPEELAALLEPPAGSGKVQEGGS